MGWVQGVYFRSSHSSSTDISSSGQAPVSQMPHLSAEKPGVHAKGCSSGAQWGPHFYAVSQGRSLCYCSPIASTSGRCCRTALSTRCCSITWRTPSPLISTTGASLSSGRMSPWTGSSGPTSMAAMWRRLCLRGSRAQVGNQAPREGAGPHHGRSNSGRSRPAACKP